MEEQGDWGPAWCTITPSFFFLVCAPPYVSPPCPLTPLPAVPVSVSRTFAFSRGDSLAGSPGNGTWLWVPHLPPPMKKGMGRNKSHKWIGLFLHFP